MSKTGRSVVEDMGYDFAEAISHGMIVSELAVLVSQELNMDSDFCNRIAIAGFLHDVGKLRMSEELHLDRSQAMVVEKMKYVRMHTTFSRDILREHGYDDDICKMIYHHHENNDGSGYPENLEGENIPIEARVMRVCDVYAALISDRSYREAFSPEVAVELMIEEAKHFDMKVFLAFMRVIHSDGYKKVESLLKKNIEEDARIFFEEYILKGVIEEMQLNNDNE